MKNNSLAFTIPLKKEVVLARKKQIPLKWFYSKVREERERGEIIFDIGTTIRPRLKEIIFLRKVIEEGEKESKERNFYFEYSSSWGLKDLREAIADYLFSFHQIEIDPIKEIMITRGVIDSYEKILQLFPWGGVILPSWTPEFFVTKAILYKIPIIRIPLNIKNGNFKLTVLEKKIDPQKRWLLVINHPIYPCGLLMNEFFLEEKLFPFCQKNNIFIFSETFFNSQRLDGKPFRPLLSFPQAKKICVEIISLHRELGTPGIRVGAILGNEEFINSLRIISSLKLEIVPPVFQLMMARILRKLLLEKKSIIGIEDIVKELKKEIIPRLKKMNWPFIMPEAGIEMVVKVPPSFIRKEIKDPSLFTAFVFLKRYKVVFVPCSVFSNSAGKKWLRIELRQKENQITEALEKMIKNGFHWKNSQPTKEEIESFLQETKNLFLDWRKI